MLCVFFFVCVFVYTRTCQNNASISNFGDGFRFVSESSWCIGEITFWNNFCVYNKRLKIQHSWLNKFITNK
ncbi:hypothetical protein FWK35_00018386 [Aphis craccivora]|uniref:Secreted protein n=1 Tax=Aphis craccivora TaxID=307492 RepID=A0A6G0Z4P7_APHCR|nr:hypothetical protein FWK35_00018386 [Aphis craccivora]